MNYEVEFIPVDSGSKSGDAITVRWSEDGGNTFKIGVIDGGTKESGEAIVRHIEKYYGTCDVDFVLNTHPDSDHCSGLTVVLEKLNVKSLWMHLPWNYSGELITFIKDGRVTPGSLEERLKERLSRAHELYELAVAKKVNVFEPFQGNTVGPFRVLSPSRDWYKELVCKFRDMPSADIQRFPLIAKAISKVINVVEDFHIETLREGGETSPENESSVVLSAQFTDNRKILLTGDVGIQGLTKAADYADTALPGWNQKINAIQIPHHGSRRNVSPSILDRILGSKTQSEDRGWAYCSASKDSEEHPRKSVINAFTRRGYKCCATKGQTKRHYSGMPEREGWVKVTPLQLYSEVESYD